MDKQYTAYQLEEGMELLVEVPEGTVMTPRKMTGAPTDAVWKNEKAFNEAIGPAVQSAKQLLHKLTDMKADEVELTFSLTATGELGNFAIGKVGIEAGYTVKLTWKKDAPAAPAEAKK